MDEVRLKKPTVLDEVENGLYYFRTSLFKAIPEVYRDLEKAIKRVYHRNDIKVSSFIRFGSWIGGDRDGNPFVTPDITREAVYMHAETALHEYIRRAQKLSHAFDTRLGLPPRQLIFYHLLLMMKNIVRRHLKIQHKIFKRAL